MTGKKIGNPRTSSTKSTRIGNLLDYMERPETEDEHEKCVYSNGINFVFDSSQAQRAEMIALAMECPRSKDPIDHYVLSWKEGEQPTAVQCDEAARILLDQLGLKGNQCRYALHHDTHNYHLHIAVNRVDPETEKAIHVAYPVNRLHETIALVEHRQGWEREPNGVYVVNENDEPIRITDDRTDVAQVSANARSLEARTGQKSAERIAIEEAAPIMRRADSWRQLHEELAKHGIRFEQKGSGAILHIGTEIVKASTAGRDCSLSRLEKRLHAPYEPAAKSIDAARRDPEPVVGEAPHWTEYVKVRREYFERRKEQKSALETKQQQERTALRENQKAERRDAFERRNWRGKGNLLNTLRSVMAADHASQCAGLKTRHQDERKKLNARLGRFPEYENWLRQEYSDQVADQWRYLQSESEPKFAVLIGTTDETPKPRDIRSFISEADERTGRVTYRRLYGTKIGFVDRGKIIDVRDWKDEDTLLAAMQLAAQKWGTIQVYGSEEYKARCVKLAAEYDFKLQNPELQQAVSQERARIEEERNPRRAPSKRNVMPETPEARPRAETLEERYNRHREDLLQKLHSRVDPSRTDWMIAVRLRVTGHSKKQIKLALENCAPKRRPMERRNWMKYATATAERVFGERGYRDALRMNQYRDDLMRLEGRDARELAGRAISRERQPQRERPTRTIKPHGR